MTNIHSTPQNRSTFRPLLITWALSAGYFLLLCVIFSFLNDSIIRVLGISGAGILALMVPWSTAFLSTFLIPHWLVARFLKCCAFSFPVPTLLCIGSTFMIPSGVPNRELYVAQVITLGLATSSFGTVIGWIIRRGR